MTHDQHPSASGPIPAGPAARVAALSETPDAPVAQVFDDPMEVVEAQDAEYGARLEVLQRWKAEVCDDGAAAAAVAAAITALEARTAQDWIAPDTDTPYGYGVQREEPEPDR